MVLPLALLSAAWIAPALAWPEADMWQPLPKGAGVVGDEVGDTLNPVLDVVGTPSDAALTWFADPVDAWWSVGLAGDPRAGAGLEPLLWGVLLEVDGDAAWDGLLAADGTTGELALYANFDGAPGVDPGFVHYRPRGVHGAYDGADTGAIRVVEGSDGGTRLELTLPRSVLEAELGVSDDTELRMLAVTSSSLYLPWEDVSSCAGGACLHVDVVFSLPVSLDRDGDGLSGPEEAWLGTSDDDRDADDDGVIDGLEAVGDTDGDGVVDALDCDSDGDGLLDGTEVGIHGPTRDADTDPYAACYAPDLDRTTTTDPRVVDSDGGGVPDGVEDWGGDGRLDLPWETDPTDPSDDVDTDGDGVPDAVEAAAPDGVVDDVDSDGDGIADASEWPGDPDGDGVPSFADDDSDGDGIADVDEGAVDSDGDGLGDFLDEDSDGDGIADAIEGTVDSDGDGTVDRLDEDSDGDSLEDEREGGEDTDGDGVPNYLDDDSDGDGLPDTVELGRDSDGDGIPDRDELDSDDDGIPDAVEGDVDTDRDEIPDYRDTDSDGDGRDDVDEGVGDTDCDGRPDYADSDDESGFCDTGQPLPEVDPDAAAPPFAERGGGVGPGAVTGGSCSHAGPTPLGAVGSLFVALLVRRRGLVLAAAVAGGPAQGQELNAQRFGPSVDGGPLVLVEDTHTTAGSAGAGLWIDHADDPLVFRTDDGEVELLGSITTAHLLGHVDLGPGRVGVELPLHVASAGWGTSGQPHVGDLRLSSKLRLGRLGGAAEVGAWLDGTLPTATGAWVGDLRAVAAGGVVGTLGGERLLGSATLGVASGTGAELGELEIGPALVWGAGASTPVGPALTASLELVGEAGLATAAAPGAHPVEWLASVRQRATRRAGLALGLGSGLTRGAGAPDLRAVAGLQLALGAPEL